MHLFTPFPLPSETLLALSSLDLSLEVPEIPEMTSLLNQTLFLRGKKLRPLLCFLMGKLFHLPVEGVAPYAKAVEWVHAATLAHDDVIDQNIQRRNQPTLNVRTSNARAVLAGDLLLARVMVELSRLGCLDIISELSKTIELLVAGEWLQLNARGRWVSRAHLEQVAFHKTGSLMCFACTLAPRLRGEGEALLKAAFAFGQSLGLAFQMIDDCLDFQTGGEKPFAQDLREGLVNFFTLESGELYPELKPSLLQDLSHPEQIQAPGPWTPLQFERIQQQVRLRAVQNLSHAREVLYQLFESIPSGGNPEAFSALLNLLEQLQVRTT